MAASAKTSPKSTATKSKAKAKPTKKAAAKSKTGKNSIKAPIKASKHEIFIKGARSNNLKNIDLKLPKNKLIVVTGVSGSGKSSITMDTLYAEGQRRYVESLSSYARQFLGRMKKPDVDYIHGICPAIAIEQKVATSNARSTVGTLTEIYDFLRLLYARIGKTISPISGNEVKRHQVSDVLDYLAGLPDGTKVQLYTPLPTKYGDRTLAVQLDLLFKKGFTRLIDKEETIQIEDFLAGKDKRLKKQLDTLQKEDLRILIDRFVIKSDDEENNKRIADSVQTAFYESEGEAVVAPIGLEEMRFNTRFELDGREFIEPSPQLFNFNNPFGACPRCEGFGRIMGIDESKVIPNKSLSVYEDAVAPWRGEQGSLWKQQVVRHAQKVDFPVHTAYSQLTKAQVKMLWKGTKHFDGIDAYFKELEAKTYKIQNRVMLARYRGKTTCSVCEGGRLREDAGYVFVGGKTITDLIDLPIDELQVFFSKLDLSGFDSQIAKRLLLEINARIRFMLAVGLKYLTINRVSSTLSGGETQRINLTRMLGSNLTSSMYILDEPSIGLHPRDTNRLVSVLRRLRDLGNTVVVVEHEEDIIAAADYLVDIGPEAGVHGGEVVFAGNYTDIDKAAPNSLTTKYMTGEMSIPLPEFRRRPHKWITLEGANMHNLKNVDVKIPLDALTVVSGVSGSGKTTLVKQILFPFLKRHLGEPYTGLMGSLKELKGDLRHITQVDMINQNPIGKSSRSNPVTYVKAYDDIRNLMADQPLSRVRGFQPRHFSFNVDGGRCDTCKGEGEQVIEMQFLADVRLECETCKGKRFKREVIEVTYRNKSIHDILSMTVTEALEFFADQRTVLRKLKPLEDVGLGYITLGQSSSTLSGGEAQRVKLAYYLGQENSSQRILFIFDEPTTGLHFHDVRKLLVALNSLVDKGHTVLVVEHNLEVMKCADYIIDLGPEAGINGGQLLYQGQPEGLIKVKKSHTGRYLKEKMG
jgi:excinuclease ABC subunit A